MKAPQKQVRFKCKLVMSKTGSGWHFLVFGNRIEKKLGFEDKYRRVLCSINGSKKFHCALMPDGKEFYIIVNKNRRDALRIVAGDTVDVVLEKDESKYGLPMPPEVKEVLRQDNEADKLFHALTPGKQRSLLYWLSRVKDIDRRIQAALIVVEHLKENNGKVDGDKLHNEMKRSLL